LCFSSVDAVARQKGCRGKIKWRVGKPLSNVVVQPSRPANKVSWSRFTHREISTLTWFPKQGHATIGCEVMKEYYEKC